MFIRNSIPHKTVRLCDSITLECVCVRLASDIYIVAAYNNPRNEFKNNEISNLLNIGNRVIIFVDLNARHKTWNCHVENRRGKVIFDYVQNNNCFLMYPNKPTLYPDNGMTPTTIDMGINKNASSLSDGKVVHELSSDHTPVLFTLGAQYKLIRSRLTYDYDKTDRPKFQFN